MDIETYDQFSMPEEAVDDAANYLKESLIVEVLFHEDNPLKLELPIFVELKVTETDPGLKGDTSGGGGKPATLETGAVVRVPLFIQQDELVKVNTRTGEYIERVS